MKYSIKLLLLILAICLIACSQMRTNRPNGWYLITNGTKDSISKEPIVTVKDFVVLKLDSDRNTKYQIIGRISKHKCSKWANSTEKAIGKQIGFIYENKIITAPQVNQRIEGGNFAISGHNLKVLFYQIRQEKVDFIKSLFKGWDKDSLYDELSKSETDSMMMQIDYWEAYEWKNMGANPLDHYWYSITDTIEYQKLENALHEELQKFNINSHSKDYMTSTAYLNYKSYIYAHHEYINLTFQSFLFEESPKGLYGYLIDDIIRKKYSKAPSIRDFVKHTDNKDDEKFAINDYQKKIWRLMNLERKKGEEVTSADDETDSLREQEHKKAWEGANKYRATITDSVYLNATVPMSDQAIAYLTPTGWNMDYAYNQVVYLKALERAKTHLVIKQNQLILNLKSGAEINISDDLFQYIAGFVVSNWNELIRKGIVEIEKTDKGYYDIVPPKKVQQE